MSILAYQILIIVTLLIAWFWGHLFGIPDLLVYIFGIPDLLVYTAFFWTLFTLAFVYFSPLMALQLFVIWGVTGIILSKSGNGQGN